MVSAIFCALYLGAVFLLPSNKPCPSLRIRPALLRFLVFVLLFSSHTDLILSPFQRLLKGVSKGSEREVKGI